MTTRLSEDPPSNRIELEFGVLGMFLLAILIISTGGGLTEHR
jgi:hypothetical protein